MKLYVSTKKVILVLAMGEDVDMCTLLPFEMVGFLICITEIIAAPLGAYGIAVVCTPG